MKQFISGCLATLAVVLVGFKDADAPKESEKPQWHYRTEMVKHTIIQTNNKELQEIHANMAGTGLSMNIIASMMKNKNSSLCKGERLAHVVQNGDWLALVFENQVIETSFDDKNEADSPTKQN